MIRHRTMTGYDAMCDVRGSLLCLCCLVVVTSGLPCGEVIVSGVSTVYTSYECGLTDWPGDVPLNVTDVSLEQNTIAWLQYTAPLLDNLVYLSLKYNQLVEFPDFSGFAATLETLDISRNDLTSINASNLDILVSIEVLDLSYNSLTSIPDVSGPAFTLETLLLTGNDGFVFTTLYNLGATLKELSLNKIANLTFDPDDLWTLSSLNKLRLAYNDLNIFPNLTLIAGQLSYLFISNNQFTSVPTELLELLVNLQGFHIQEGELTEFPDITPFIGTLRLINFGYNHFPESMSHLTYIIENIDHPDAHIGAEGSGLTTVPHELCDHRLPKILLVGGNPLVCDCRLRWLKMAELSGMGLEIDNQPCAGPSSLVSRTWDSITLDDLQCLGKYKAVTIAYNVLYSNGLL